MNFLVHENEEMNSFELNNLIYKFCEKKLNEFSKFRFKSLNFAVKKILS